MKNRKTNNSGFTLVEVIIASLILVVAIIPLMGSFVTSSRMNVKGRQKEQAMTVAENIMEGIKAVGVENSVKWANGSGSGYSVIPSCASKSLVINNNVQATDSSEEVLNFRMVDKTMLKDLGYTKITYVLSNNVIKIDDILMGQTYYDAYVIIKQDDSEVDNKIAYAFYDQFSAAGVKIMKYYNIEIFVHPDYSGVYSTVKGDKTDEPSISDYEAYFVSGNYEAKYSGTVISQSSVSLTTTPTETTGADGTS